MQKPNLSTLLICLALFLFFTLLSFPYQNLRGYIFGRIHKETGILIMADELFPSFFGWPGLGMRNAEITIPAPMLGIPAGGDLEVAAKKVVFRVGIGHFFPPTPSLSVSLDDLKKGGSAFTRFSQTAGQFQDRFQADAVDLSQLLPGSFNNSVSGILTADADFSFDRKDLSKSTGHVDLTIDKLRMGVQNVMGMVFNATDLGQLKAKLQIRNGTLEISNFQIGDDKSDLSGTATGDLRLGSTLTQSFLNLTLRLKASSAYRQNPQSATLLSFLESFQTTPGNYALRWTASFQEMATNTFKALPQKAAP